MIFGDLWMIYEVILGFSKNLIYAVILGFSKTLIYGVIYA